MRLKKGVPPVPSDSSALSFVPESCLASRSASFPLGDSMRACARPRNSLQRCVRQRSFCLRDSPCPQSLLLRRRPVLQVVSPAAFIRSIQFMDFVGLQTLSTLIICRSAAIFNLQSAGRMSGGSNDAKRRSWSCTGPAIAKIEQWHAAWGRLCLHAGRCMLLEAGSC